MLAIGEVFGRDADLRDRRRQHVAVGALVPARRRGRAPTTASSSSACSAPAFRRRSARSSASPEREVVCVTGDGAAGFNFMEMQSAARERLKITTIVFAEGSWTMEEPNERMLYGRTFGTAMGEVRWDKVAEGLGCQSAYVETREQLTTALVRARAGERPTVSASGPIAKPISRYRRSSFSASSKSIKGRSNDRPRGSDVVGRRVGAVALDRARPTPSPVADLRHVVAVLGDVLLVLDQLVADRLLGVGGARRPAAARGRSRRRPGGSGRGR